MSEQLQGRRIAFLVANEGFAEGVHEGQRAGAATHG